MPKNLLGWFGLHEVDGELGLGSVQELVRRWAGFHAPPLANEATMEKASFWTPRRD